MKEWDFKTVPAFKSSKSILNISGICSIYKIYLLAATSTTLLRMSKTKHFLGLPRPRCVLCTYMYSINMNVCKCVGGKNNFPFFLSRECLKFNWGKINVLIRRHNGPSQFCLWQSSGAFPMACSTFPHFRY